MASNGEGRLVERTIMGVVATLLALGLTQEIRRREVIEDRLLSVQTALAGQTVTLQSLNQQLDRLERALEEHRLFHYQHQEPGGKVK